VHVISEPRIYKRTAGLWLAVVLVHLAWHLMPFALGTVPPVPQGEAYFANDVGFQAFVFAASLLQYWVAVLLAALFAEFVVFRCLKQRSGSKGRTTAP
jgi:hypothetical protein